MQQKKCIWITIFSIGKKARFLECSGVWYSVSALRQRSPNNWILTCKTFSLLIEKLQWHLWKISLPFLHPQRKVLIPILVLIALPGTQVSQLHCIVLLKTGLAPQQDTVRRSEVLFTWFARVQLQNYTQNLREVQLSPPLAIIPWMYL